MTTRKPSPPRERVYPVATANRLCLGIVAELRRQLAAMSAERKAS